MPIHAYLGPDLQRPTRYDSRDDPADPGVAAQHSSAD